MEHLGKIKIDCYTGLDNLYRELDRYISESIVDAFVKEDYKIYYDTHIDQTDCSRNVVYHVKSNTPNNQTIDIVTINCYTTNTPVYWFGLNGHTVYVQVYMTNTGPLTLNPETVLPIEVQCNLNHLKCEYNDINEDMFDAESRAMAYDYDNGRC